MIELKKVSKRFGDNVVLNDFSAVFDDGKKYFITGDSGKGKTTLLNLISGIYKYDSGSISGTAALRFSYVFQDDRLIPSLNAGENIKIVNDGISKESICEMLSCIGLENVWYKMPDELSGGMKKRVSIVRALAFDGDVFLLDEPFSGLDNDSKSKCISLLKLKTSDKTVILATHNGDEAKILFDNNFYSVKI